MACGVALDLAPQSVASAIATFGSHVLGDLSVAMNVYPAGVRHEFLCAVAVENLVYVREAPGVTGGVSI